VVTREQLRQIMPHLTDARLTEYFPFLEAAMKAFEITSYLREAAFLAQLAHESGELRWMQELGSGKEYEGRLDLGNTDPGDGPRFKGRGPIQLTGRANYRKYGELLGLDLVHDPAQAATPQVGFRIAGQFWALHGLNTLADEGDMRQITRRINGGLNGFADRMHFYERAKLVLSKDDATADVGPPARVRVNGQEVPDARPFLQNDRLMVAVRPVAKAAGLRLLQAADGHAVVQDLRKENHTLALLIRENVGYVALHDLPGKVDWDSATRTASFQAAA
jgi:predicted chitinase